MARVVGDTSGYGSYLRVGTRDRAKKLYVKGFKALRNPDGRYLELTRSEAKQLVHLLSVAVTEANGGPVNRDEASLRRQERKARRQAAAAKRQATLAAKKNDGNNETGNYTNLMDPNFDGWDKLLRGDWAD